MADSKSVGGPISSQAIGDAPHYTYQPLEDELDIRLIKLYPYKFADGPRGNRKNPLSPLTIEFVHCLLAKAPFFHAFSYTWGLPTWDTILIAGGEVLTTTQRVRALLQNLRPEAGTKPLYVWIDQLCINQKDEEEKMQQIRIMRDIYTTAGGTLIALSENHDSADRLFALIDRIGFAPLEKLQGWLSISPGNEAAPGIGLAHGWSSSNLPAVIKTFFNHKQVIKDLETLLNDPVFRRAWIYQEIVSSWNPHITTATYRLKFDVFARVFELYVRIKNEKSKFAMQLPHHLRALSMLICDRIQHLSGRHKDWTHLHVQAQGLLFCTNPRDSTIALTTFQGFYKAIPPSAYSTTVTGLYSVSTSAMISASKSLDVFAGLSGETHTQERQEEGLPTWVPDWSRDRDNIPFYWPLDDDSSFNAANGYKHSPDQPKSPSVNDRRVLVVHGKTIGTIGHVVRDHEFENVQGDDFSIGVFFNLRRLLHAWEAFIKLDDAAAALDKGGAARTLMGMMTVSTGSQSEFTEDNIRAENFRDTLLNEMVHLVDCADLVNDDMEALVNSLAMIYGGTARAKAKVRQWGAICLGRRVAFGAGNAVGLVPKSAVAGDKICLLHGSKVPILLRCPEDGVSHKVLGQCYWHDWMFGEKVTWSEDEGDTFLLI